MELFQSIGLTVCLLSNEPNGKRNLINDHVEKIKLLTLFIMLIFIIIFTLINFLKLSKDETILKTLFSIFKFTCICLIILKVILKYNLIKQKTVLITFYEPIRSFLNNFGSKAL